MRPFAYILPIMLIGPGAPTGFAQDEDLAGYFGFEGLEIIKIGDDAGPILAADVNGDGATDLVAVNNHDSRLEIHYQRPGATPDDAMAAPARVNEFPEHWRFRREFVSVTHLVAAIVAHDFDGDGLTDFIYAGVPGEIVFIRQASPGVFEVTRRHRVKNLLGNRDALAVADVKGDERDDERDDEQGDEQGDERPELVGIVDGNVTVWPLDGDALGQPLELAAGGPVVAFVVNDFDGDDRRDIVGIVPEDPAPVRIWFGGADAQHVAPGAQIRFEMPAVLECTSIRLPGEAAARLAVIERASKRIVVYDVAAEEIEETGDRDAAMHVIGFTDAGNRSRAHVVVDVDGDGLLDLVATDIEANALVVYRQRPGKGLGRGQSYPSLSKLTDVVAGQVDDDPEAELFVLSEQESVVGRCEVVAGPEGRPGTAGIGGTTITVPFPLPTNVSAGHTPTALNLVELEDGPRLAIVAKDSRDYLIDLIAMDGSTQSIPLGKLSRSPNTIVALDADQGGRTDLLLFTEDKPMTMLAATGDGFAVMESKDMGQFGLVQAAKSENVAVFDIDGDGKPELLIADQNYVRAVRYEPEPAPGTSPGWQVVAQINARDASSKLVSLAILDGRIVAADRENDRLVVMAAGEDGRWSEVESLTVRGFAMSAIHAGSFSGDGEANILAIGEDSFAVIRLAGERIVLKERAAWRASDEGRLYHELSGGDVNSDGFADLIALDAGEQMCEIFTFTEAGHMLHATGFQTFESMLFSGGETREFEPSQALIVDVTGDGANDLVLLAHDRILLYPQMVGDR